MNTEDDEFERIEREQAMRSVPDPIHHTDPGETLEYITGWNDCRAAMLAEQPEHHDPIGDAQDKLIAEAAQAQPALAHCEAGPEYCQQCHKEAMSLALEALEKMARLTGPLWALENNYAGHLEAITALREDLAQPAREWVGLTEADRKTPDMGKYVFLSEDWIDGYKTGMEKADAKLKEKNT